MLTREIVSVRLSFRIFHMLSFRYGRLLLTWLSLRCRKYRECAPPKRRQTSTELNQFQCIFSLQRDCNPNMEQNSTCIFWKCAMLSGRSWQTFLGNTLLPSSGSASKSTISADSDCCMPNGCYLLGLLFTLKLAAVTSTETSSKRITALSLPWWYNIQEMQRDYRNTSQGY
jgi:hypothetical protein